MGIESCLSVQPYSRVPFLQMEVAFTGFRSPLTGFRSPLIALGIPMKLPCSGSGSTRLGSTFGFSRNLCFTSLRINKQKQERRRGFVVRGASSTPDSDGDDAKIGPLKLESPIGQFLCQILKDHPHLVPAAVDQQLEQLQTDRESQKEQPSPSPTTDLILYRRIAEVKANERRKALEEILYALVVQKFIHANISLIPSLTPYLSSKLHFSPNEDSKLEQLHSPEAYEMIENHLTLILGNKVADLTSVAEISKFRVGQVYAASVMYGYFLKRVDQRFQLEKTIKVLPDSSVHQTTMDNEEDTSQFMSHPQVSTLPGDGGDVSPGGIKATRLRNYVMSFDGDTLQRYATIRSKEAVSIVEKHTEALFGRPEIVVTPEGTVSKDENIKISFGGLKKLVLEAVTFGSFLWDVESYVDSRYHFVLN